MLVLSADDINMTVSFASPTTSSKIEACKICTMRNRLSFELTVSQMSWVYYSVNVQLFTTAKTRFFFQINHMLAMSAV